MHPPRSDEDARYPPAGARSPRNTRIHAPRAKCPGGVSAIEAETLDRLREAARRQGVRLLCLHGSQATGRATAESDLDLAAWFGDARRALAEEARLLHAMLEALPASAPPLDLAILDLADPLLQFMVAREGEPIFEADASALTEFAVRAAGVYRDTAKYRERAHQYLKDYSRRVTEGAPRP